MEEKPEKWYTGEMSIGGIGSIGGGSNIPHAGTPAPGSPVIHVPEKIDEKKAEETTVDNAAELALSTPDEAIAQLEAMTHDALAQVSPGTLDVIATERAVLLDPDLQRRMTDIRRKLTIAAGARAYRTGYPLPVQPVPRIEKTGDREPDPDPGSPKDESDDKRQKPSD